MMTNNEFPEIWGGLECTINRVANRYIDQFDLSGHYTRPSDIDLIAQLGIKKLRFPILWERHQPVKGKPIDWSWASASLNTLRQYGIDPIAGLVHHGSGPRYTDLGKEDFAYGLASYAARVAAKFPWINYYTPVNEPLTTARFSGLYGFWYPHKKSDNDFCTMLLHELKATVLSMREIRKINPAAQLIQTEDLGKTYSVPELQYQADFENDRRWITFDLLCGMVNREHPLWDFLIRAGVSETDILFFADNPCPPSVLGVNYYVTSERFLDNRLELYPPEMHGGNWLEPYVDTEAVRVNHDSPAGLHILIREVTERYRLPVAVTECHLNCTAEDKMRWFKETWDICCRLNTDGQPVMALTAWSLFGAHGWSKLLTQAGGDYECGTFDLRGGSPRATSLFKLIRSLSIEKKYHHPVLNRKGWWHRNDRFFIQEHKVVTCENEQSIEPIIILEGNKTVTDAYLAACEKRSLNYRLIREDNDIEENIKSSHAWALINLSGASRADLESLCNRLRVKYMMLTEDRSNSTLPLHESLIIQTSTLNYNGNEGLFLPAEPLSYITAVARVSLDLLIDEEKGTWNLANGVNPLMPPKEIPDMENVFQEV